MALDGWDFLKQWQDVANECNDAWFRFIARWIAFNAFYANRFPTDGDRVRVEKLGLDPKIQGIHKSLLKDPSYVGRIKEFQDRDGILDMRDPGNDTRRKRITDPSNWHEVLQCLYQVRNNLFHADKSPRSPDDRKVVEAADAILVLVLPELLKLQESQAPGV